MVINEVGLVSVDTPDPYIILYIKDSPNGWQQTTVKDNDTKPIWNETFNFFLDSENDNTLGQTAVLWRLGVNRQTDARTRKHARTHARMHAHTHPDARTH